MKSELPPFAGEECVREGELLRDGGDLVAAEQFFLELVHRFPADAVCWFKLGTVHERAGDLEKAEAAYQRAIERQDVYPEAINNLALLALKRADYDYAEGLLRGLLGERPDYCNAHINLGNALLDTGRVVEAQYCFRRAAALEPENALPLNRLGITLRNRGRYAEGVEILKRALDLDPKNHSAWNNLGSCYFERGQHELADAAFARSIELESDQKHAWHNWLFHSNFMTLDAEGIFKRHLAYGQWLEQKYGAAEARPLAFEPRRHQRLRVGFVSGDLRRHSVAYFLLSLLDPLNREGFDLYAYSTNRAEDRITDMIRSHLKGWRSVVGLDDEAAREVILKDRIDILFDLSAHTNHNRLELFARRMAPVQMTWIGYPNTTGLRDIDYRLTDEIADPPGTADELHTEKLIRLPSPFLCFSPPVEDVPVVLPPSARNGYVTFGSFNARVKLGQECIRLWSDVLAAIPDSRMVVKSVKGLDDDAEKQDLLQQFVLAGIGADRVEIHGAKQDDRTHFELYGQVDVCLDAHPYNGTTTTCEALWMGVPVVTLRGDRHASRVGSTLLASVGLDHLIADSAAQFVTIARELALNPGQLNTLRLGMRDRLRASPLMDAKRCAGNLAQVLRKVWQLYLDQWEVAHGEVQAELDLEQLFGAVRLPAENGGDGLQLGFRFRDEMGMARLLPATPRSMSTYVFLEQRKWFEADVGFLTQVVETGDHVIDIGANVGSYALPLGAKVGPAGWLVAYEPGLESRRCLHASLSENGLVQVVVKAQAVSDFVGDAVLIEGESGEFHYLVQADGFVGNGINIQSTTLDAEARTHGWDAVDLIKIDAEGSEPAILAGGAAFFARYSPLVMFETKNGDKTSVDLRWTFRALGYRLFRLAGDYGYLIPVGAAEELDRFLINLYAAKPDRVVHLAKRGLLFEPAPFAPSDDWRTVALEAYCRLPCIAALEISPDDVLASEVGDAIIAFAAFRLTLSTPTDRHGALSLAFDILVKLERHSPSLTRSLTLARISFAMGYRSGGLLLLAKAKQQLEAGANIEEPFWPVLDRYLENYDEDDALQWIDCQLAEARELERAASSICSPADLQSLQFIVDSNYATDEMRRRLILVAAREGVERSIIDQVLTDSGRGTPDFVWSATGYEFLTERLGA